MANNGRDNWPQIALAVLVIGALVAGLWTIGGPMQGRLEQRDKTRYDHLQQMSSAIQCVAVRDGGVLPDTFDPGECFGGQRNDTDPFTDKPYIYEKTSANAYKLCAEFEDPETLSQSYNRLDPATGCITFTYKP